MGTELEPGVLYLNGEPLVSLYDVDESEIYIKKSAVLKTIRNCAFHDIY